MDRIYVAKVEGQYITQEGNDHRVLKNYSAQFRLPHANAPLAMIRGKLLMPFLKKMDPAAIAPYSWNLISLNPENGEFDPDELPIMFQSKEQLAIYCKRHQLAVPVGEYADLDLARTHVELALSSPEAFQKLFTKHSKKMKEDKELSALNQNFENIGEAGGEVEVDPATGKPSEKTPNLESEAMFD